MKSTVSDLLERDHDELDGLFASVLSSLAVGDCQQLYLDLDYFWARLAMHIRAEHHALFPALRGLSSVNDIEDILQQLRVDHDFFMVEIARAIKALRLVFSFSNEAETIEVVKDLLGPIQTRLAAHNVTEETGIYQIIASAQLPDAQLRELQTAIKHELDNLPPRFAETSAK